MTIYKVKYTPFGPLRVTGGRSKYISQGQKAGPTSNMTTSIFNY